MWVCELPHERIVSSEEIEFGEMQEILRLPIFWRQSMSDDPKLSASHIRYLLLIAVALFDAADSFMLTSTSRVEDPMGDNKEFWDKWSKRYDLIMSGDQKTYEKFNQESVLEK